MRAQRLDGKALVEDGRPLDLLCVGFGPSGIALATALDDAREAGRRDALSLRALFLERAPSSAWQPNMLLPGTDIQHHFLRDFATPRNPRSRFTFANYLRENGRLFPFCLQGARVGRIEWSDYVEWTAGQVTLPVRYRHEVRSLEPVEENGTIDALVATVCDLEAETTYEVTARNVVLALGYTPNVPALFVEHLGPRVFHSHHYLERLAELEPAERPSFAVVGSGQNAGEILLHLAGAFPDSTITSIGRNSGFRTYDLGHFSNQVYFPEETDYFYGLDRAQREAVFEQVRLTNYSSVDIDVSSALYLRVYEERLLGRDRLRMLSRVHVAGVEPRDGGYRLTLREVNHGSEQAIDVDCVILCTGFVEPRFPKLLEPLLPHLTLDDGELEVSRHYRVGTQPELTAGVYLSGITEWRHGISNATSFSMTALKAQEVLDDVQRHRALESRAVAALEPAPAGGRRDDWRAD